MTLDEAIKRYTNNAEYERTHSNLQGCLDFRQLAEWLSELEQLRERTKWTPVSEGLPDLHNHTNKYLVTLKDGSVNTDNFTECDGAQWWTWFNNGIDADEIIAWMPFPEPYMAESEVTQDADSD